MDMQNKQQSAEEGGGICCKFVAVLCLLVFVEIIVILSPNFTNNSTIMYTIRLLIVVLCLEFIDHSIDRFNSIVS
jgi:hypothetical protein